MCMGRLCAGALEVLGEPFDLYIAERARTRKVGKGDVVQLLLTDGAEQRYVEVKLALRTGAGTWTVTRHVGKHPHTKRIMYENVVLKRMCRVPKPKARFVASAHSAVSP